MNLWKAVRILAVMLVGLVSPLAFAAQGAQTFTLDGRIRAANTTNPMLDPSIHLEIQILDKNRHCILYAEQQYVNTLSSDGYFHIQVGSNPGATKRISGKDSGNTMAAIFSNGAAMAGTDAPGETCTSNTYTPATRDVRYFRILVTPSLTGMTDTLADTVLDAVPAAMVAENSEMVGGFGAAQLLRVNTTGSNVLSQSNLESIFTTTNFPILQALLAGTSTLYNKMGTNGTAVIPTVASPTTPTAGQIWYTGGVLKYSDGSTTHTISTGAGSSSVAAGAGSATAPSISFAADDDTGWFSPSANNLAAATDGVERIRINEDGNIGIGTTSAGARVTIGGTITAPAWTSSGISIRQNSGTYTDTSSSGTVAYNYINALGIPTLAASSATTYTNASTFSLYPPTSGSNVDITNSAALTINSGALTGVTNGYGLHVTAPTGATNNYAATFMGNVGIGTTTPGSRLSVAGNIATNGNLINHSGSVGGLSFDSSQRPTFGVSLGGVYSLTVNNSNGTAGTASSLIFGNGGSTGSAIESNLISTGNVDLAFATRGSNTLAERMRILANGQIGIGETSPSGQLQVTTSAAATKPLVIKAAASQTASLTDWISSSNAVLYSLDAAGTPTATTDLVTKNYVDTAVASAGGGDFLKNGSVAMTGNLKLGTNSISDDGTAGRGLSFDSGHRGTFTGTNAGEVYLAINNLSAAANSTRALSFLQGGNRTGSIVNELISSGNSLMRFSVDASGTLTERMVILSNGNVGIGATAPTALLHVNGPMRLTASALPGSPNVGDIAIDSGDSNKLKYYNGSWQTLGTGSGAGDFMKDGSVAMTGNFNAGGNKILGNTTASANLTLESTSDSTKGYVNLQPNGGNVGIGTTNPEQILHIVQEAGNSKIMNDTFTSGVASFLGRNAGGTSTALTNTTSGQTLATFGGHGYDGSSYGLWPTGYMDVYTSQSFSGTSRGTVLRFATTDNGTTSATEKMRILGNGRVGIGTTAPTALLHVTGPMRLTASALPGSPNIGDIAIDSGDSNKLKYYNGSWQTLGTGSGSGDFMKDGSVAMTGNFNAGGNKILGNTTASANLTLESTSDSTKGYVLLQPTGGNVGIGTTTPSYPLEIRIGGNASNTLLHVSGNSNTIKNNLTLQAEHSGASGGIGLGTGLNFNIENAANSYRTAATIETVATDATASAESGDIYFSTRLAGTVAEKMRIQSNGRVGIMESSPTGQLQVNTTGATVIPLVLKAAASQTASLTNWISSTNTVLYGLAATGTPAATTDLVTKTYVDTAIAGTGTGDFKKDGSVAMTGNFNAGGNKILGNTTASANLTLESTSDSTKGYVILQPTGGNVGIGTTAPTGRLHSVSSGDVPALTLEAPGVTSQPAFHLNNLPTSTSTSTGKAFSFTVGSETNARGMFYSDGKYGIGPGSATRDVYISRNAASSLMISSDATSTGAANLVVTGNVAVGDTSTGTIKAAKELVLRQDGDTYGSTILRLRNRNNENGAIFETNDATANLVDFIFKSNTHQRNIRMEGRSAQAKAGQGSWHIGGTVPDDPTLAIGDSYVYLKNNMRLSGATSGYVTLWAPAVAGTTNFRLPAGNGTNGYVLTTDGSGNTSWAAGGGGGDFKADGTVAMTGNLNTGGQKVLGNTTASANLTLESTTNATKGYVLMQPSGGNVGIGTTTPRAALDVVGAILGPASISGNIATYIDFANGNIQHTTANCTSNIKLYNMKDGGTYTFIVKGTTIGTCSFLAYSDAGTTGLTVKMPPGHGATTSGKHTLYSLLVSGTDVYVSWVPGY